ncbi:threonine dehydratase [Nocardia brasiliensis NBRC 14402]|uniref:threonine ammonia-lyase n=1 Tax=Nocardia brasiliensis TaxID=37326 RepID=UPI0003120E4D|nr:threonine ammonia-lyase [Nocardia brasiliensis]ASF08572.1 threonine ammonia-lyase [Nocardia brasiliensis]GAJ85855.1 threonine dehydratase [Nocardia brasiliensis NBRC 14402]SUB40925.1 L-threonine dehydratase catabolic TdcB [Nocardia brasiliensis]
MCGMELVGMERIEAAAALLAPVMRKTPMVTLRVLSERVGTEVLLKCENLQRTGSFKPRGAYNRIANLPAEDRARGVVAASAGNHAQGVAWAAASLGLASTVFMPVGASLPKLAATKAYGAEVRQVGETIEDSLDAAREFAERTGATLIHPFDHPDIVAGQATVALEILEQVPDLGAVLVPTGGGGLIAGVAVALHKLAPQVRVIGVQAAEAAAWPGSLAAGKPVRVARMSTMADGIAVGQPGQVPFAHVAEHVSTMLTVDEDSLSKALLLCLERAKLIVEPAGAAAVAALMSCAAADLDLDLARPVCAILSGGNIDPLLLTRLIGHGLSAAGRYLAVRVTIADRPGGLSALLAVVGKTGASVVDVAHSRTGTWLALNEVEVSLTLETRGHTHRDDVLTALTNAGYSVRVED